MPTEIRAASVASPKEILSEPKKRFITYAKQIDKYNIKRCRVELTPAVCDVCGFDLGSHNNLGSFAEMEPATREAVQKAIKKHKEEFHSRADALIVDEDQMPKSYLGSKRMQTGK